jgi:hypothetical protein
MSDPPYWGRNTPDSNIATPENRGNINVSGEAGEAQTGGEVTFADLEAVYTVDTGDDGPARRVSEGSYLLPTGQTGVVWIIGAEADWASRLDTGTGRLIDRFDLADVISWAEGGLASGLIVQPVDPSIGNLAYWTPDGQLRSLEQGEGVRLLTTSGDVAVFITEVNTIRVIDMSSSLTLGEAAVDVEDGFPSNACLSPDATALALHVTPARLLVIDVSSGEISHSIGLEAETELIGWTSPNQIVTQADTADGRILQIVDLPARTTTTFATLTGTLGTWWASPSEYTC